MKIKTIGWPLAILVVTVCTFVCTGHAVLALGAGAFTVCLALGI